MKSNKDPNDYLKPEYIVEETLSDGRHAVKLHFEDVSKASACFHALQSYPHRNKNKVQHKLGNPELCEWRLDTGSSSHYVSITTSAGEWQNITKGKSSFLLEALQAQNPTLTAETLREVKRYSERPNFESIPHNTQWPQSNNFAPTITASTHNLDDIILSFSDQQQALRFKHALEARNIQHAHYNYAPTYTNEGPRYHFTLSLDMKIGDMLAPHAQQQLHKLYVTALGFNTSSEETINQRVANAPIDCNQNTILHRAALDGNPALLEKILGTESGKALIHAQNDRGWTALMVAANRNPYYGHIGVSERLRQDSECTTLLLKAGASASIEIRSTNSGTSALMMAAQHGKDAIVSQLIAQGADITAVNNDGKNALHHADYFPDTQKLIEGAILTSQEAGNPSSTPSIQKVRHKLSSGVYINIHEDAIVSQLIAQGADVTTVNNDGKNALHHADYFPNTQKLIEGAILTSQEAGNPSSTPSTFIGGGNQPSNQPPSSERMTNSPTAGKTSQRI